MSENNFNVTEQLRCSHCEGYLSCTPICLLPNGNLTCGRCAPLNDGALVYRALAIESAFSNVSFPCRFKQYGCKETVSLDKATEHENNCSYRTFACPTLPEVDCKWEGPTFEILNHFAENHPDFVMQNAELELQVEQNLQGILLTMMNDVVFIMKFEYNACEKQFKYNIRYSPNKPVNDVRYKVKLTSMPENDCTTELKTNKCPMLINNILDKQSAVVMNLSSFLEMAEHPMNVTIVFNLTVVDSKNVSYGLVVNYSLLDSIRCHKCRKYLIPPLFEVDNQTICSDCAEFYNVPYIPSSNTKIEKLITVANYPCRWRECNFVGKSGSIKMHQFMCNKNPMNRRIIPFGAEPRSFAR